LGSALKCQYIKKRTSEKVKEMPRTITEHLMYSTTKITSMLKGAETGSGTGFYFSVKIPGNEVYSIPLLITNKHVLNGADSFLFKAHIRDAQGKPTGEVHTCLQLVNAISVIPHPDPQIDLCAILMADLFNETERRGKPIFFTALEEGLIPSEEEWSNFDAVENLLMVGCPRGIYDEVNNIPIFRRGYSATPLSRDYEGNATFLMDMACFPGSSGSPVFLYDSTGYIDVKTKTNVMGQRVKFVGVLFRGPLVNNEGQIIFNNIPMVEVKSMMHLGEVIKSNQLKALTDEILSRGQKQLAAEMAKSLVGEAPKPAAS
jgi:hypothetical protein